MKKFLFACLIVLFALGLYALPVLAQEATNTGISEEQAGVLPDSPFYFLKIWAEKVRETFTLNSEAKLKLMEDLGEKRALEAQKLIEKGKPELAEKLMQKYQDRLKKMQEFIDKKGEKLDNRLEQAQERIQSRFEHRNEVLKRVMEKAPEAAKSGLQRAMDNSEKQLQNLKTRIEDRIKKRDERNNRIRDRLLNLNAAENENGNTNQAD